MEEIIIKKDQDSSSKSVELVSDYLENYKYDKVLRPRNNKKIHWL